MGIFKSGSFVTYRATLQIRDKLMAGTPKDPKMLAAWIAVKTGITNKDLLNDLVRKSLAETGINPPDAGFAEVKSASEEVMVERSLNVFKRDAHGIYLESRCVKAGLRESVSIAFGGERWVQDVDGTGKRPNKGANNLFRERVFINPDRIYLGRAKADDVMLFTGHVMTPQGQRSNVGFIEYVENATVIFDVRVFKDTIADEKWPVIWELFQEIGLGSMRSQGFGRFDIVGWDLVKAGDEFPALLYADTINLAGVAAD